MAQAQCPMETLHLHCCWKSAKNTAQIREKQQDPLSSPFTPDNENFFHFFLFFLIWKMKRILFNTWFNNHLKGDKCNNPEKLVQWNPIKMGENCGDLQIQSRQFMPNDTSDYFLLSIKLHSSFPNTIINASYCYLHMYQDTNISSFHNCWNTVWCLSHWATLFGSS